MPTDNLPEEEVNKTPETTPPEPEENPTVPEENAQDTAPKTEDSSAPTENEPASEQTTGAPATAEPKKHLPLIWKRVLVVAIALCVVAVAGHFLYSILLSAPSPSEIDVTEPDDIDEEEAAAPIPAIETEPLFESGYVRDGAIGPFTYAVHEDYITITGCKKTEQEVVVPETLEGLPVMELGDGAFQMCSVLQKVTLPVSLRQINEFCFYGCTALETIVIPESVHKIDSYAFNQCVSLTEVEITTGVKELGVYVFDETPYSLSCEEEFQIVGDGILIGYYGEGGDIVLPSEVRVINSMSNSELLTGIFVPINVQEIGAYAFAGCGNLASVNLPDGLKKIGEYAFSGCAFLTTLVIPEGVESIGASAFAYCSNIKSVRYPASVKEIGDNQFEMDDTLESINVLPNTFASDYFGASIYASLVVSETE